MRVMAFTALLGGCAASGVQVSEQQARAFEVGKSTYADVVSALGEPTSVTSSSRGGRVAVYSYAAISSRPQNFIPYIGPWVAGYDRKSSAVTFVFDQSGVLAETNTTQHTIGAGANLAAGSPQGRSNPVPAQR
jgi:hypothetical protein